MGERARKRRLPGRLRRRGRMVSAALALGAVSLGCGISFGHWREVGAETGVVGEGTVSSEELSRTGVASSADAKSPSPKASASPSVRPSASPSPSAKVSSSKSPGEVKADSGKPAHQATADPDFPVPVEIGNATQVITVKSSGSYATVTAWAKGSARWKPVPSTSAGRVGSNGVVPGSTRRQNTEREPARGSA